MTGESGAYTGFEKAFNGKQTQLVTRWIHGDLETPVSAYLKLCGHDSYAFLLESVEGGETLGRYSVIGHDPDLLWSCNIKTMQASIWHEDSGWHVQDESPLQSLRRHIAATRIDTVPEGLPPMAVSGLFGHMGYDMIRLAEDIPDNKPADESVHDALLMRPRALVIFDNVKNMICIAVPCYDHAANSSEKAEAAYKKANSVIDAKLNKLQTPLPYAGLQTPARPDMKKGAVPLRFNMNKAAYTAMVEKAVEYIHAGETFQTVLGQRMEIDFEADPFELYRALRRLNPSPFLFHLNCKDYAIVGASPEILVRVRDNTVTVRPIAGTRKRGKTKAEDAALAEDLLSDPKERAEHLMLLDLGRNDVGRVAEIGTVRVTEEFIIENYSHVMHIVSNVEGTLSSDKDIVDALLSGFPAGTVSGAPKVRAMEIIEELEPTRRGYYGGCVGYLSGNGILDTCIALRTALIKDGKMIVQAGGGIVADSNAEDEYQETRNKAQALIRAAETVLGYSGE